MSKHTPGPWKQHLVDETLIVDRNGTHIATACGDYPLEYATIEANARLIAAAPELLAALKDAKAWVQHWQRDFEANLKPTETSLANALSFISAAIAKAEE